MVGLLTLEELSKINLSGVSLIFVMPLEGSASTFSPLHQDGNATIQSPFLEAAWGER
jgi:hypothetical protein